MSAAATAPSLDRRLRLLSLALLLTLAGVMLSTFLDYGITGDEGVRHRYGRRLLRYYATLGSNREAVANVDISRDGGVFEITTGVLSLASPLDFYDTRHLVVVFFALLGFLGVYDVGRRLGGPGAAFLSVLFLALTPPFYGHSFNNSKDVPFAALFILAADALLRLGEDGLRPRLSRVMVAAVSIGLVAGERVAGVVFLAYAPILWTGLFFLERQGTDGPRPGLAPTLKRLGASWLVLAGVAWTVMLAFWPWAQTRPFRNPIQALQMFSNFWDCMVVFYDGQFVCSGKVSRFYLLRWFSLTLPESYAVAVAVAGWLLLRLLRLRALAPDTRTRALKAGWLLFVVAFPVTWAVVMHTPLYDGLRHFLFVMPVLAVLAGASVAAFLRARGRTIAGGAVGVALGATFLVTLVDMIQLHPYQAVYFNRLIAGGLERAITRYEGDYWCLSYKEGVEWLLKRYSGAECGDRIRVAGNSVFQQTAYYLRKTPEARRLFQAADGKADPHFVLTTTRDGDHLRTPGQVVHLVKRQHAALLYLFQLKAPPCDPRSASVAPAP